MCILGWKAKKTHDSHTPPFSEKEFRLMRGDFRDYLTDQSKAGYYGICDCAWDMICPPGSAAVQDRFYQLVDCFAQRLLQDKPSVVIIEDVSGSQCWTAHKTRFKHLAADHDGVVFEEHCTTKDVCAFVFRAMPDSFLDEVFGWVRQCACTESLYAQYSTLAQSDLPFSSISEIRKNTKVNVLVDDVHPVLILQTARHDLAEDAMKVLDSACEQFGFSLIVE